MRRFFTLVLSTLILINFAYTQAGSTTVNGQITDASTNEPIIGAQIQLLGIATATSKEDGTFAIELPGSNATLHVSGKGYQVKRVPLKGKTDIQIKLHEQGFASIFNTVKLPFSNQIKQNVINATETVNGTLTQPNISVDGLMQGKMNGLNIISRSGTPGIGSNLFLRGYNSLLANSQPLIVVDGMVYDYQNHSQALLSGYLSNALAHIDVKDIESITLIKDGNSLYGSKAANGVILINTFQPKDFATQIDFYTHAGFKLTPDFIPMMDAENYKSYLVEQLGNMGYSPSEIQNMDEMKDDKTESGYYRFHNNTNWQDEIYKNGLEQNYYLRVLGGDQIAKYGLSVGFLKTDGIVKNSNYAKYNTRFNADVTVTSKLKIFTNLAFSYNNGSLFDDGIVPRTSPTFLALTKPPLLAPYRIDDNGQTTPDLENHDGMFSNPVAITENMMGDFQNYRFFGTVGLKLNLTKGLNIGTLVGINYDNQREDIFIPENGVLPEILQNDSARNTAKTSLNKYYGIYSDTKLNYMKSIGSNQHINAVLGMRYNTSSNENDWGMAYNTPSDEVKNLGAGVSDLRKVGGGLGEWKWLSYYSGAEYSLMEKYLLSYNISVDGSSRFGEKADGIDLLGRKFGVFPSFGAAWIISSENFMPSFKNLDLLKVRFSLGKTGNDDIGNYADAKYYSSYRYSTSTGLVRSNIPNPYIQWETTKKMNIGFDLAMFNEKLQINGDVFKNTTENLLTYSQLGYFTGVGGILSNNGTLDNNGFELNLSTRVIDKTLKWDIRAGYAKYTNTITSLPEEIITQVGDANIISKQGHALNSFYGYKTKGIFASDDDAALSGLKQKLPNGTYQNFEGGDVIFEDLDKNGTIDKNDMQIIGDPNPDFTGMFSNMLSWKRFSLDALLTCSYGFDVYNRLRANLESMSGYENQTISVQNRWKYNGQVTDVPKATYGDPMGNARFSDRWVEEDVFLLRLKTVSLSYNMPINSEYLNNALIYITTNNILSLSNYLGYDPESSSSGSSLAQGIDNGLTPIHKSVFVGVKIGL